MRQGDFVGRDPDVHSLVVKNQAFEVDQFPGEPQTVACIREMGPRDPALPDWAARQPFVEPGDSVFGSRKWLSLSLPDFSGPIVICCLGLGAKSGEIFR